MKTLFEINPELDRKALASRFARSGRVQVRNVLTDESARELQAVLTSATPWGMAIKSGEDDRQPPARFANDQLRTSEGVRQANEAAAAAERTSAEGGYGFRFAQFSLVEAVQQRWMPDGPHEILLEHLNAEPFLDLVRQVTAIPELAKADGQATLFAKGNYLGRHIDSHVAEGWRVAYVLNLAREDWHPDWGGYLTFLDEDGDIVEGFKPRFNALNLFAVPQAHAVTYVPPFAPLGRLAVTGWLRDQ
jgi:Rps23 Pro-64 3,4-dihydroxylase Tpa1-like proline 4-hydroxylase